GLEIDVIHGQGPHQAGTDVVGPRHAAEGAALAALVDAVLPCARAIGHAQPAGTAAAAFTGRTRHRAALAGPGHAKGRDRSAGQRGHGAANRPHLVEAIAAPQLDLVAAVVEQVAVAVVVGRMVPVLDHAGIAVVGVRVHRALVVALELRPQVGRIEGPLVIPCAVDLELHGLVGTLRGRVADDLVAAGLDVTLLRGVDRDPAVLGAALGGGPPQGQGFPRVGDRPEVAVAYAAQCVDAHVVHGIGHAPVGRVDAPGPGLVDHGL